MLNTENQWLNIIITHPKFISSPFTSLFLTIFQYFLNLSPSYIAMNIGIKHDFLCINICWAPREVLKPEPEKGGFQHLPRGPADVNVSERHV